MGTRSKIHTLPPAVKAWLDAALVDSNFSGYDLLEAELKKRGCDISRSAVHRYGQQFEQRLAALKLASEQAKAIVEAAPDDEGAVTEALMRLVQEKLFGVLLDFQVDPKKPINIAAAAKAVAELCRATVTQKKWVAEVRAQAKLVADSVKDRAIKGGLSAEVADTIRREILGIGQ